MYPRELDRLFRLKDKRLDKLLSKIWLLNINARALAINKLMERTSNQKYIEEKNPSLRKSYFEAKRKWFWCLVPVGILIVVSQFEQAYEMLFNREQFQEKINNSWINNIFK